MLKKNIKPNQIDRRWYIVDASDHILGRMSSRIATVLQGKHRAYYSPQWDMGDYVVVTNARTVKVTGRKEEKKMYHHHTGYPGGLRSETLRQKRARRPLDVIELAVKRMLPKNKLAREMIKKLKIYEGGEHPHAAQQPVELTF